ncbi:MFS transporter [Liquorilactobacillus mali]|uniref:Transporter major facilitator superfamily MFS 1 n=1 Tax=Liquorilactobacillus mali KCTC 3596 = DSM 20444 TaxID=1046596 RepID=A0A0R2E1Z2_9LACO|nr:MFS transporter [Liquorilactobacillus mali]KRN10400.1 transporter major facilitator superfamily MFS 1 [Liquorilactobacillus mali KCTC 3596 = DSM 20444]QFQ74630.1 MFS transporter [Liquorilactobacillus mali]
MEKTKNIFVTDKESNIQIGKDITSNLISSLTGNMFSFSLGLMLLNITNSPLSFGLEMIIMPLVNLLFVVPIGNIVDSVAHKKIIISSLLSRLLALFILSATIGFFKDNYLFIPITIFVTINTICSNFNSTAYSAAIHEVVNQNHIQKLSSFTQAASSLSAIIAPPLGMTLYSLLGFKWMIFLEIFASLISFAIVLSMHFHYSPRKKQVSSIQKKNTRLTSQIKKFSNGLKYIHRQKLIMEMITIGIFINFLFTSLTIGMPYILSNNLHLGNGSISFLESGNSIGMLLGSLIIGIIPDKLSMKRKLFCSLIPTILSFICLGIVLACLKGYLTITILGTLLMVILGFSLIILNVTTQVFLQKSVPTDLLGRVMSSITTINTSVMPIGTLVFALLFAHIHEGAWILITNGVIMLAYSLWRMTKI